MSKPTTPAFITMTYDAWEKAFDPISNTVTPDSPYGGSMFETYGADLAEVLVWANGKRRHLQVWTLVEGDDGERYVVDGYRLVNRLGYFLTNKPAKSGVQYEVTEA